MMDALIQLVIFLLETAIIVVAVLIILAGIGSLFAKGKDLKKSKLNIKKINALLKEQLENLQKVVLNKKAFKQFKKQQKKSSKTHKDKRVFVVNFEGDIKASQVTSLRQEITGILAIANDKDEVVVKLESPGGLVSGYGLAASQLYRLKEKNIPLTVCVDKVAASGGYLMACVADKIVAAPFAILGSIGVLAQIPNFNRFLTDKKIDFEQITAGEYKRTLSVFGKNTDAGREKFKESITEIHDQFKSFVHKHRPQLNIDEIATGEHWLGHKAFELRLVDILKTSDDYILEQLPKADIYTVRFTQKKRLTTKVTEGLQSAISKMFLTLKQQEQDHQNYL